MEKPWFQHYEEKVPQSIYYPEVPMYGLFAEAARKRPQCTALIAHLALMKLGAIVVSTNRKN